MKNTVLNVNGYDVEIYTDKGNNGKIVCSAQFGKQREGRGYTTFSFEMYTDPHLVLAASPPNTRATEKALQTIHAAGLAKFEQMKAAGELPTKKDPFAEIQPGQIVRFHGYGHEGERIAIYELDENSGFKCVNLDTLKLTTFQHIKNIEDKRAGVGVYYKSGETVDMETVNKALSEAIAKREAETRAEEEKAAAAAEARRKAIETGAATLPAIPAGMTHVIVAEHRVNKSDYMTDYHAYETEERHYLAFSRHDRNLFDEMRAAAGNSNDAGIKKYRIKPEGGEARDEHRENYSGGAGYYLGDSKYSGWIIQKRTISKDGERWGVKLEDLQIAIAENRYFIPTPGAEPETTPQDLPSFGDIQVIDYSEKAIAVTGNTKPIKDELKALGGRFNFRLSCGVGWIFPKTKSAEVCALLEKLGALEPQTALDKALESVFTA